jgi:hypothetical protein
MGDIIEAITEDETGRVLARSHYEDNNSYPTNIVLYDNRDRDINLSFLGDINGIEEYKMDFNYQEETDFLILSKLYVATDDKVVEVDMPDTSIKKNSVDVLIDETSENLVQEFYDESVKFYDWKYYMRYIRTISGSIPGRSLCNKLKKAILNLPDKI